MLEIREHFTYMSEVKKSRFIAHAVKASTPGEALAAVEMLRDKAATHNCWAYRIGDEYRFSDDGEPGGTAGRPILAAIEKLEVDNCLVLVTRFFGGIKLGAGGLARAYGGAAAACLRNAPTQEIRPLVRLMVTSPFDATGELYVIINKHGAEKASESFSEAGVTLTVVLNAASESAFKREAAEATRGRAVVEKTSSTIK